MSWSCSGTALEDIPIETPGLAWHFSARHFGSGGSPQDTESADLSDGLKHLADE
jgi:hypothetical protein